MTKKLSVLFCLSFVACEEASFEQHQNKPTLDAEVNQSESLENQNANVEEQNTENQPDLICASSGFYDQDGFKTLRMELFQRDQNILVLVDKGEIHPIENDGVESEVYVVEGTIGSDFFNLSLDSETEVSENVFQTNFSIGMERQMVEGQLFYQGTFNQFACGPYSNPSVTCWEPEIEPEFKYNALHGVCLNDRQEVGFNPWTLEMVRETGDGQCASLSFVELNEGDYTETDLTWDLRGSDLEYSWISSTNLHNAQLEGAQFESLYFGNVEISGSIDDFTAFPEDCVQNNETVLCKM